MSMYCVVQTEFKDQESLIDALCETGEWTRNQIESHDYPASLYGYLGDARKECANIIIRRAFIGRSSNDIGFIKTSENNYVAIISEFDKNKFNQTWLNKLKQNYAFHVLRRTHEAKGRSVTRERLENGRQRVNIRIGR